MPMHRIASARMARAPMAMGQASRDPRVSNRASPEGCDVAAPGVALACRRPGSCSATDIGRVEARDLGPCPAGGWELDAGVVGGVGPGVLEDREAGVDDEGDAPLGQGFPCAVELRSGEHLALRKL